MEQATRARQFKLLRTEVNYDQRTVTLQDADHGWKYYIEMSADPEEAAAELLKIARWLKPGIGKEREKVKHHFVVAPGHEPGQGCGHKHTLFQTALACMKKRVNSDDDEIFRYTRKRGKWVREQMTTK
jgi:hypothetical protein